MYGVYPGPAPEMCIRDSNKPYYHCLDVLKQLMDKMCIRDRALAVLLSACGADGKAYTTADAQALIDADAFDGEMEQVDSYTVAPVSYTHLDVYKRQV